MLHAFLGKTVHMTTLLPDAVAPRHANTSGSQYGYTRFYYMQSMQQRALRPVGLPYGT